MTKIYHMIIEKEPPFYNKNQDMSSTRREYLSANQGDAPHGWRCVGVCGYHEEPKRKKHTGGDGETCL